MFAEGPLTGLPEQSAGWLDGPLRSFRVYVLLCSMCSEWGLLKVLNERAMLNERATRATGRWRLAACVCVYVIVWE